MPEHLSAAKTKAEPKKQPVRTPLPDHQVDSPNVDTPSLESPSQTFSSQQLIQLQRTLGNKAVGDLIRRQKAAEPASTVKLRTTANVIQPLGNPFKKKKPAEVAPAAVAAPAPAPAPAPEGGRIVGISSPITSKPMVPDLEKNRVATSDVEASTAQMDNPVLALKTYREAVGVHLRDGKRHKFKIERYKAFVEADFVHIKSTAPTLIAQDKALKKQEEHAAIAQGKPGALKDKRVDLDKKIKKLGGSSAQEAELQAEARVQLAYTASNVAESELPMIEYSYDTLVKMRHDDLEGSKHGTLFGSGNPAERVRYYTEKRDMAKMIAESPNPSVSAKAKAVNAKDVIKYNEHIKKQQARVDAIEQARKDLIKAQTLRGQAKLSEDVMLVKRKQLKIEKQNIAKFERNVQLGAHVKNKILTGVGSAIVSTVTLGTQEYEASKGDGGYTAKRERVSMLETWRRDWASLKSVWTTRPYGKMTALHLFFQGLGTLILKPLRKVFAALSLIFAGLSLIPPIAPITGALAAFCTLVTLGLVAAKVAVDALLATWSALAFALNKNAHNSDTLKGQALGQAGDAISGAIAGASAIALPVIGNAAGGSYVNPLENISHGTSVGDYAPGSGGSSDIMHQLQVQGFKGAATLGFILGEKGFGAIIEFEALSPASKALFKARQEDILARKVTGPQLYLEVERAKLATLEHEENVINKRIEFNSTPQGSADRVVAARKQLASVRQEMALSKTKIAGAATGAPASSPTAAPSPATSAKKIESNREETVSLPAQEQFAARMNPEAEKEREHRAASTQALGSKAKAQVQALVSGVSSSQSQTAEMASGANAAASGVAAAGTAQGVQPVDGPNAADAQENIGAGQEILQQVVEVAQAAPAAVDEALAPQPAAP